jgi:hypothetical protein
MQKYMNYILEYQFESEAANNVLTKYQTEMAKKKNEAFNNAPKNY